MEHEPLMPPDDPHSGAKLRHLRYLVAVTEAGTFTQATERLFVAQPALSQQVCRLALSDPLDAIELGKFEPELWIPAAVSAGHRRAVGLDELAGMDVVHSPRRANPVVYDAVPGPGQADADDHPR